MKEIGKNILKCSIAGISFLLLLIGSCDMPETQDELNGDMPAVWAVFSPEEQIKVYINYVEPYDGNEQDEYYSDTANYLHDAILILISEDGDTVEFSEYYSDDWPYNYYYSPVDSLYRVSYGKTYTLKGITRIGNFEGSFTVPDEPVVWINSDTAYFSEHPDWAFAVSIDCNASCYEIWCGELGYLGGIIPYSGNWVDMFWSPSELPDTFGISWCIFWEEGEYELVIRIGDENYYNYAKYYEHNDGAGIDDQTIAQPTGIGYIGVIGSAIDWIDTVFVFN